MASDLDLRTRADPEIVAGFRDIDVVELKREVRQHGKSWPPGTIGTIVYLGTGPSGCIVEIGNEGDLIDAAYSDLALLTRKA